LTATLLFSQQQEQSKQKSAVPKRFFILLNKSLFNAPVRTAHPCAEPNLVETSCFHLLKELIEQEKRNGNHLPAFVWYSSKFSYLSLEKPPNGKILFMLKKIRKTKIFDSPFQALYCSIDYYF
jgi:hypothetical protein